MALVMAVSMEHLAVAEHVCSTHALRDNVIDFPDISIFKRESTVATFPVLIFEKLCNYSEGLCSCRKTGDLLE